MTILWKNLSKHLLAFFPVIYFKRKNKKNLLCMNFLKLDPSVGLEMYGFVVASDALAQVNL